MIALSNLLPSQRIVIAIAATASILLLAIHNPFNGYRYQGYVKHFAPLQLKSECPDPSRLMELAAKRDGFTLEDGNDFRELSNKCWKQDVTEELELLPFSRWESKGALLDVLGPTINVLVAFAAVAGICGVWLLVLSFGTKSEA